LKRGTDTIARASVEAVRKGKLLIGVSIPRSARPTRDFSGSPGAKGNPRQRTRVPLLAPRLSAACKALRTLQTSFDRLEKVLGPGARARGDVLARLESDWTGARL
jgi:hypothetical protein